MCSIAGHSSARHESSVPAHVAQTEDERDDAIIRWVKLQVECHPEFLQYMRSKAEPQCVSEVLKQYTIVSGMLQQLLGLTTPVNCEGAPSCVIKMVRFDFRSTQYGSTSDVF